MDCLESRLTCVIHWLTDFLMESGDVSLFVDNISTVISADLPLFGFSCVAQLFPDIDVLPGDLITGPYSVESN